MPRPRSAFNSLDAHAKRRRPTSPASQHDELVALPDPTMTAVSPAATWSGRPCSACCADIQAGKIDVIVSTRSTALAARWTSPRSSRPSTHGVSFVSVTQHFNRHHLDGPADPECPLALRPVRARSDQRTDPRQVRRQPRKGMWMGGNVPLGYRVEARKPGRGGAGRPSWCDGSLPGSRHGLLRGAAFRALFFFFFFFFFYMDQGRPIYKILGNRAFRGQAVHQGVAYPEHAAIVDQELWDRAHGVMSEPLASALRPLGPGADAAQGPDLQTDGRPISPSHTKRRGRVHRYYITREAIAETTTVARSRASRRPISRRRSWRRCNGS